MQILQDYTTIELLWIAFSVLLLGMTKGGFPVGPIALPLLILVWPVQAGAAKQVVAFMLPLLCMMDVCAVAVYRRHIQWRRIVGLMPGALVGVLAASLLFVSRDAALIGVSDRSLKLLIGVIGLGFVAYRASRKWLLQHLGQSATPGVATRAMFGFTAGVTSTIAHAAGPVAQIYFLPRNLPKMQFAATIAGFFFWLNAVKLIPFALLGRFDRQTLELGLLMVPVIPVGVGCGYLLVRAMKGTAYIGLIYCVLAFTSAMLILKAWSG